MADVLALIPGGKSRIYVNPSNPPPSETIVTEDDQQPQVFVSPIGSNIFYSPNPIVIAPESTEITTLQTQVTDLLTAVNELTNSVNILQTEQEADIPVQRLQYIPSSPSSTWIITHNFGYIPSVELYINGSEAFTDVSSTTTTSTLTFPSPQTGVAILN